MFYVQNKSAFSPEQMIFVSPTLAADEELALQRIEAQRDNLRYFVANRPKRWFGSIRRLLAARAIRGSNSIEGYNVSVEDALAAVEGGEPTDPRSDDYVAVNGYQRAMTYVLQLARDEHFEYTAQLLRSLHFMMTEHWTDASPGLWRPGSIWVKNEASGDTVYEAPHHDAVPELIEELIGSLADAGDAPSTVQAAMAHLNLAMIHPFRDGNGRMSRCLQTLVLARQGIVAPELCSIEEFLGSNTDSYYAVLAQVGGGRWSPTNDARPWVRYCLGAHYAQGATVLRRINEWGEAWARCEELADERRLPNRCVVILTDATLGLAIRNSSYRARLESADADTISAQVASRDLHVLVSAGLLVPHGSKRGAFYTAGEPLARLGRGIIERRTRVSPDDVFLAETAPIVPELSL